MGTNMRIVRTGSGGTGGGGEVALTELIEREVTVEVSGFANLYVPIDVGFEKYEIRTIFAENPDRTDYVLSIYDNETGGDIIYKSLQESGTYDIVNVPCSDKSRSNKVHLFIENKASTPATIRVVIRLTNFL